MAYSKGMHNIVSIIDIFHDKTDERIVKYLGKKYIDRAKKQQQAFFFESSTQSIQKSGVVSPKVGMSLYEKRMQAFAATRTFFDSATGEPFEVSQLTLENNPEIDAKIAQTAPGNNITHSEMVSLWNEIDNIKPPSGYLDDEDSDDEVKDKIEKPKTVNKSKLVVSSQTIGANVSEKNLTELVLEKIKKVEKAKAYAQNDPAKQRNLNNRKSFSYGEYTVDMVVKDLSQETSRSEENSLRSFSSEIMLMVPPRTPMNQTPGSQQRQRTRLQSSKSIKSVKSNYEINLDKECQIIDVYTGLKSAVSKKSENLDAKSPNKPRTPASKITSNIPHVVPDSVAQFNPNETFYAKKPSTAATVTISLCSVETNHIKDLPEKHLNKMNNFYYLNTLASTNRSTTKHLVDELRRNEREMPVLPVLSSRSHTGKTVTVAGSPVVSARNNSSPERKQRCESERPYYSARPSVLMGKRQPLSNQLQVQRLSNKIDVQNSENKIMNKYLDSLKRGGLYNQNSKPIIRNLLVETNKSRDKLQRSY
jgi:hypothetical protein